MEGRVVGGYEILRFVGPVLGGTLFDARDVELQRAAWLRVIAPELAASPGFAIRFGREQALAAALYHPHVLTTLDAGETDDGTFYVATRSVGGAPLDALLAAEGALRYPRATEIVSQLAGALDEAHRNGLVHRGLRPSAVVVTREPSEHVYLADFGLADDTTRYDGLARAPAGTAPPGPEYASPEQIRGEPVDARSDVYALGCLAFELVTGRVPYPADAAGDMLAAHLLAPPPSALGLRPNVPPFFDSVIARALAKDPAERFATAGELADAIPSKPRVLSRWRSMIDAGTMEPGALDDAAAAQAAQAAAPDAHGTARTRPAARAATLRRGRRETRQPDPDPDPDAPPRSVLDGHVPPGVEPRPGTEPEPGEDFAPDGAFEPEEVVAALDDLAPGEGFTLDDAPEPGEDFAPDPPVRERTGASSATGARDRDRADAQTLFDDAWADPADDGAGAETPHTLAAAATGAGIRTRWRRPGARRAALRRRLPALLALAALLGAGALALAGVFSGPDDDPSIGAPAALDAARATGGGGTDTTAAGAPLPAGSERDDGGRTQPWPDGRRAYTAVVYTSPDDRRTTLQRARRAARMGYRSGVLRSDDFHNLELGRWVAFAGVYEGPTAAERAVARLRRAGVAPAPYVVLVNGRD